MFPLRVGSTSQGPERVNEQVEVGGRGKDMLQMLAQSLDTLPSP